MEGKQELIKNLFQQEFSKMVAVINSQFGLQYMELAEDVISETFLLATETWECKGLPRNPAAWLYTVAKRKMLGQFRRNKIFEKKIIPELTSRQEATAQNELLSFSQKNIRDSQLQMLFAICSPVIASEAQIGLALRILCGFGIDEIAEAFISNKETINKRLFRAKEKLRAEKVCMELPSENEIPKRLDSVLHIIYLLFNEGYYSKTRNPVLQKELCLEALRLGLMLTEYVRTNLPKTNALLALMCFHTSRFDARLSNQDALVLYEHQDHACWDMDLINQGWHYLSLSTQGEELSPYHIEAKIASWHSVKEDTPEKWKDILNLYDQLLLMQYSQTVALNRAFAVYKLKGREAALAEAEKLKLENNHFYFVLLGELFRNLDNSRAELYLKKAYALARTKPEKQLIRTKMEGLS